MITLTSLQYLYFSQYFKIFFENSEEMEYECEIVFANQFSMAKKKMAFCKIKTLLKFYRNCTLIWKYF